MTEEKEITSWSLSDGHPGETSAYMKRVEWNEHASFGNDFYSSFNIVPILTLLKHIEDEWFSYSASYSIDDELAFEGLDKLINDTRD